MISRCTNVRAALRAKQRGFIMSPYAFGGGGGGSSDPNFASVILLNNHQGANNSTTFTDQSPVGRTLTAFGNAKISTTAFVFGTSSAYFDGSGDYVDATTQVTIDGTTSWTWESWFRPDDNSYTGGIASLKGINFYLNSGGDSHIIGMEYYSAAAATRRIAGGSDNNSTGPKTTGLDMTANTWYFLQLVNNAGANTLKCYVGTVGSGTGTEYMSTTKLGLKYRYYGAAGSPGLDYFKGYLGPVRLTSGVARANAVPTDLFPTS